MSEKALLAASVVARISGEALGKSVIKDNEALTDENLDFICSQFRKGIEKGLGLSLSPEGEEDVEEAGIDH